jgi:hypothetical protein
MWDDIVKNLAKFPNAVLTGTDTNGYPFSVRCIPQIDPSQKLLRLVNMGHLPIQSGLAGLLCHSHDELLWDLKSFMVRGNLRPDEQGWVFQPTQFIPGTGMGGPLEPMKFILRMRKTAKQYLEKRGLARPQVQWQGFRKIWADVKKGN